MKPDDKIIDKIKKIMSENESLYKVSPSLFDPLFEAGEIVTFPRGYMIMKAGRQLRDVYVIIDGLVGSFYESGSKVILHGLATPGTLLIHGASFSMSSLHSCIGRPLLPQLPCVCPTALSVNISTVAMNSPSGCTAWPRML